MNRYLSSDKEFLGEVEKAFARKVFWLIPNDYPAVSQAANYGDTLEATAPRAKITQSYEELATTFAEPKEKPADNHRPLLGRYLASIKTKLAL
jgi:MinD-like ATPase involved in chromosome partitioning or flagellar assembly